jgi:hypothetical protein
MVGLVACGGSSSTGSTCNPCDPGSSGGTSTAGGHDANPDGVPYPQPASGYGRTPRTGNTPGSVIQNFKFLGYPNADSSQGLQTISLADYYDPCNKRYKMIHLSVAAVWCQPCNQETDAMVGAKAQLDSEQIVVLQALDDGATVGQPAQQSDLDYWVRDHGVNFTEMMDPELHNFGGFFAAAAIPWNADLDPRTMELIDSSDGWSGDISTEISLSALPASPGYPVASCQ